MEETDATLSTGNEGLGRKMTWWLVLVGLVGVVVAISGLMSRERTETSLAKWTQSQAIPTVDVVSPSRGVYRQELVLPGEIQAWFTAPIYARVSGYIKMWYKDYGAKVKEGDVLAEIDAPDLDQKLEQAKGDLEKAKANVALANVTTKRWQALRGSNAVSQQAADEKAGEYQARVAEVSAAQAYVAQLEAFEAFKKLIAPFNGIVTARKVDVGALVHSSAPGTPALFEVSDVHEMRLYVDVPQAFASQIREGMNAVFTLPQYLDRKFEAVVMTTSNAISRPSRSLIVELRCGNKDSLLQPGSYAEIHFELPADKNALTLPASTLIFRRAGPQVALIGPENKITLKPIDIGRDLGTEIEVRSGLSINEKVVLSPSDSIKDGDIVRVAGDGQDLPQISAR